MNIDELKLVFNALKQCNTYAFAGGLGLLRATAHRDAVAILEKALAQPEPVAHSVIAGVLFDFMGWLTSRKERIVLSSADNASPAVEAITEFAKMRNLSLDDAKVQDWHTGAPQRTEQEPVAWRTFDGEGQYEYRAYEDNESYAEDWNKRNPNHIGWVEPLYTHPLQRIELQIKLTDPFESARVGDYNRGWNDCLFASGIVKNT